MVITSGKIEYRDEDEEVENTNTTNTSDTNTPDTPNNDNKEEPKTTNQNYVPFGGKGFSLRGNNR